MLKKPSRLSCRDLSRLIRTPTERKIVKYFSTHSFNKSFTLMEMSNDLNLASSTTHHVLIRMYKRGEIKYNVTITPKLNPKLVMPPGSSILKVIDFVYSKKIKENVFEAEIAHMHDEYFKALNEKREWKAKWIHIKGIYFLLKAAFQQLPISLLKRIIEIWKIG